MRIAIVGNSGSGKSTLARQLAEIHSLPLLDLDTVAWEPGRVAVPRSPAKATAELNAFLDARRLGDACSLGLREHSLLDAATRRLGLSARACHRILRVARTIADLAGLERVGVGELSEAIGYRRLDREPQAAAG